MILLVYVLITGIIKNVIPLGITGQMLSATKTIALWLLKSFLDMTVIYISGSHLV